MSCGAGRGARQPTQPRAQTGAQEAAVAGNLVWQDNALNASTNLRRTSVSLRASWTHEVWQPALDVLVHPRDGGFVSTASLGWQGDRVRLDGGVRVYGGPSDAVLVQTPVRRIAFVASTWSF